VSFAVLNHRGRDRDQSFPDGAGEPGAEGHPPINYHAYAACMNGRFYADVRKVTHETTDVLLLLRRDLTRALDAVRRLKSAGKRVYVCFKEAGNHQVPHAFCKPKAVEGFFKLIDAADGYIASTPWMARLFVHAGVERGIYLPTPYPVDVEAWNFSEPPQTRAGIFVGTREFDVPSRNHFQAVLAACRLAREANTRVTVVTPKGRLPARILKDLQKTYDCLDVVEGPLSYLDFLRTMARHKLVFQLDQSEVPGQVAGDALLCGLPCVGGNSAIELSVLLDLYASRLGTRNPYRQAESLLLEEKMYEDMCGALQHAANERISFGATARKLTDFLAEQD